MDKKYIFAVVALLLLYYISQKAKKMDKNNPFGALKKALIDRLGADKATLAMSQILHETGGKITPLARLNNFSGITYIGQKYAKDSHVKQPDGKYNYASYASIADYVEDYLRIVGKSVKNAVTIDDYARNLKRQNYYTDTLQNYTAGMVYWAKKVANV